MYRAPKVPLTSHTMVRWEVPYGFDMERVQQHGQVYTIAT
jgi:hypothetical protein